MFSGPNTHRSPYYPSVGPVENVALLHATRRTIVQCTEYGMVGAPYPQRYLTCPSERGNLLEKGWSDNGMFVPDPEATVPRRHQVRMSSLPRYQRHAPGLEIGNPEADFPLRAVLLFRYDVMEIGIDPSRSPFVFGGSAEWDCRHTVELSEPFGGLTESDLGDRNYFANAPLSAAAYRAAEQARAYLSTIRRAGK